MFLFNLSFSWGITALLLRFCLESIRDITDEKGNDCSTVLLLGRVKCCRAPSGFHQVLWRDLCAVLHHSNIKWPDPQINLSKSNQGRLLLAPLPCHVFVFQISPTSLQLERLTGYGQRAKFILSSCPFSLLAEHWGCLAPHFCHVFLTLCLSWGAFYSPCDVIIPLQIHTFQGGSMPSFRDCFPTDSKIGTNLMMFFYSIWHHRNVI